MWTERVFVNLLLVLKGVVLAYGAQVFVEILNSGPPWESALHAARYVAAIATTLVVPLTFVSQAFGSAHTSIHPTTPVILISSAHSMSEIIAYGLLQPGPTGPRPLTSWFLAVAANGVGGALITTLVLAQIRGPSRPDVSGSNEQVSNVKGDRRGSLALVAIACTFALLAEFARLQPWVGMLGALVIGGLGLLALEGQQLKAVPVGAAGPSTLRQNRVDDER
jgi:hypothetical protein